MTLMKLFRRDASSPGRGRVRTWSPAAHQSTPRSRGRQAPGALRIAARILLWALLGTLVVRGAIPARPARPRPLPTHAVQAPQRVEAFAVAFATEYLTVDRSSADRARRLAPYVSPGLASNLEVAGPPSRMQRVLFAVPGGITPTGAGYTVTVAALLSPPPTLAGDRWVWLAVPVAGGRGALAVAELPSIVPGPARLAVPPPKIDARDLELADRARPILEHFFSLYLEGGDPGDLAYLTVPGSHFDPPVPFADKVALTDVTARRAGRDVIAAVHVLATDPSGLSWPLAYEVRLEDQAGRLEIAGVFPASPPTSSGR